MESLNLFLNKFRQLKPANWDLEQALIASIKQHTGLDLPRQALKISRHGVYLQASAAVKNLIFLNREKIEADMLTQINYQTKVFG